MTGSQLVKRIQTLLLSIGLGAAMVGCTADPLVKPFWLLNEATFRQLVPGQSTTADAFALLGKPILQMTFDRTGDQVWDYRYMDYATNMYAMVYFDRTGVYKGYTSQMDPAFYNGGSSN